MALRPAINQKKGKVGERKVDKELNPMFLGKFKHHKINNLILLDEKGKSHQIDHIVITSKGIFCIETKNLAGHILGNENQEKWIQCLGGKKYPFPNPLKQNRSHIYHLNQIVKNSYPIESVVVMSQNNANSISCANVVNLDDIRKYITEFESNTLLSDEEMDHIYTILLEANQEISNREHQKNISKTKNEIKEGICPRCSGRLIQKKGKYGSFYGCSNYPGCTFKIKEK